MHVGLAALTTTHGSHGRARFRLHEPRLADLPSAIEWLREHWDGQREAPVRLHESHTTDGDPLTRAEINDIRAAAGSKAAPVRAPEMAVGGQAFSGRFMATLNWQPRQSYQITMTQTCSHPMNGGRERDCPECLGVGVKDVTVDRYPHPMSTALYELRKETTLPGFVPSLAVIYALAASAFRPRVAMQLLNIEDEAIILRAIRRLFGKYQAGPVVSVGWTQMSESQQKAVVDGEAA